MIYNFENYSLDLARQELLCGSDPVAVEPQVFDLLLFLIRNRDRVVSKDDLIEYVWNGRIVSDSTLSSRITATRQAIGDSGENQRLIRTIVRKGFRFVGDVQEKQTSDDTDGAPSSVPAAEAGEGPDPLGSAPLRLPDKPSIAVLPFTNMSGDPEQEYFSDGITEDIITALSRLRWFFLIARNSTFVYKDRVADVRQVGRDLGVRYLLEGSVRKSGQQVRVTAQLMDAVTGTHIWADRYDRELIDIFALQDEITTNVTAAIEPKVLAAEGLRAESRSIEDLDAWDLVARALACFWRLTAPESEQAITILEHAVERHPNYAPAHSLLAFALLVSGHMGWRRCTSDAATAERLARRAIERDDIDPWAHMALGYLSFTQRLTDDAFAHYYRAIDLNPNFAPAYGYAGWSLSHDGRTNDAIRNLQQASRMSPRDPFNVFYMVGFAATYYLSGEYTKAIDWARQALQVRPAHLGARRKLCASLAQDGQMEEAKTEMDTLREMQPELSIAWIKQSVPYTSEPMEKFLEGMRNAGLTD